MVFNRIAQCAFFKMSVRKHIFNTINNIVLHYDGRVHMKNSHLCMVD